MAIKDKARLRARLTELYPKASRLKAERLDAMAAKLKCTDESTDEEIDEELTLINDNGLNTFEEIVIEDDRVANLLKKKRPRINTPKSPETTDPDEEEDPSDATPYAKLEKQIKELADKLAQKEAQEQKRNLAERFSSDPRLKNVPKSWIKNNIPASEEDFEEAIEALVEDYKEFATEHKLGTYGGDTPRAAAASQGGKTAEVSKEEADKLASQLLGNIR